MVHWCTVASPSTARAVHSIIDPESLGRTIAEQYGIPVRSTVLLRSLVNELYRVDADDRSYAAKLYRTDDPDRLRSRLGWEVALVDHLQQVPEIDVPAIVRSLDRQPLIMVDAPEGPRALIIGGWLPGAKPAAPADDQLYQDFGRLIARFHAATDDLPASDDAPVYDLQRCLEQPMAALEPVLRHHAGDWQLIKQIGAAARDRLTADPPVDLGVGHGDVSLDNVLMSDSGLSIHDFDLTGIRWRAADLTGVAMTDHFDAFLGGYRRIREISNRDLAALPWLQVVGLIANLEFHLVRKPSVRGTDSINEGWAQRELDALAGLAARLRNG